jgi:glutamyl-tRNA synthetase
MQSVITRFPPSPTGALHIGGARTALFNWLFARHHHGKFILRIEDTDLARSTEESVKAILDSMEWLGLEWDEGPHFQTQRFDVYREYLQKLLNTGHGYYCDCTPEDLEKRRQQALAEGRKPKYDGRCRTRDLGPGPNRVVRFRCPDVGTTVLDDLVKGPIFFSNAELDDLVLQRGDGVPTYNFAVVIDDVTMNISHVIRGDDHVNNTPRQVLIYQALGATLPLFGHVPMILGPDRARLSKRHGATSVMAYRDMGYLPEALVNYLVRLGWSHGDQEIFSREELINTFSLENVGKAAGVFNAEKLLWLNAHYIKEKRPEELVPLVVPLLSAHGYPPRSAAYLAKAIATLQSRSQTLADMARSMGIYLVDQVAYDPEATKKFLTAEMKQPFAELLTALERLDGFAEKTLDATFHEVADKLGLKLGKLAQPVRVALTGATVSPGLFELIEVLGKETVLGRLRRALELIDRDAT